MNPFAHDLFMVNEIVSPSISPKNFKGWNTVNEYHSRIQAGGISDIKARNEVTLHAEFHSEYMSETHIYCTEVFNDCLIETQNFLKMSYMADSSEITDYQNPIPNSIEISFLPNSQFIYLDINPNPSNSIFNLHLLSNDLINSSIEIKVYDMIGKLIHYQTTNTLSSTINLENNPPGIYQVQLKTDSRIFNQKIVLQ